MIKTVVGLWIGLIMVMAGCASVPQERYDALLSERNKIEEEKKALSEKYDALVGSLVESKSKDPSAGETTANFNKIQLNSQEEGRADYDNGDTDWWEIQIEEAGKLRLSVKIREAEEDLDIEFYGKTNESSEETDLEELEVDVTPGLYYLKVFGYEAGNASDYTLSNEFESNTAGLADASVFTLGSEAEDRVDLKQKDWWRFDVEEDGQLHITVNILESGQDLDIELYDENKELVADSAEETDTEKITTEVVSGTYYLKVFGYEGENTSAYTLSANFESSTAGFADASELPFGSEIEDRIDLNENDWWKLDVAEKGQLHLTLNILDPGQDLDIEFYGETGELITESAEETEIEEMIVDVTPGIYFIKVFGFEGESSSSYLLSSSFGSITAGFADASDLFLNSEIEDRVDLNENDWWRIGVENEGELKIVLNILEAEQDLDIELYDETGELIAESAEETDIEEIRADITFGVYYLKVFGFEGGSSSAYLLSSSFGSVAERIENASDFLLNSEIEDRVDLNEKDWWRIGVEIGGELKIVLNILESEQDLDIELYDENEELIAESAEETDVEEIIVNVSSGVYYLKVFGFEGESASDYLLSNSFTGSGGQS